MQEVIPRVIQFGLEEMKLETIEAELSPRNLKSVRLLEKNNFKLAEVNEDNPDSVVYALRRQAMCYNISTLLTRNLQDVFGENDPARRRAAIDEIWTEDGVFYDPKTGVHRGRDEIDRVAGAIRATHPDFRYQPIAKPEELGDGGRVKWVAGRPGEAPAYAGTDFIIARDGRIAALYLFFDKLL
jgi:hypothetical protein